LVNPFENSDIWQYLPNVASSGNPARSSNVLVWFNCTELSRRQNSLRPHLLARPRPVDDRPNFYSPASWRLISWSIRGCDVSELLPQTESHNVWAEVQSNKLPQLPWNCG